MAFVQRLIDVSFSMGGGGAVNLSGLRVSCKLANAGSPSQGNAEVTIYGMTLSQMNQLSQIGRQYGVLQPNYISIFAGDKQSGMPLAFSGQIGSAWVDGQSQPEVCFRVSAWAAQLQALMTSTPTSVAGSADVATLLQQIAKAAGLQFENNGVDKKIANPYLPRSYREQIMSLCSATGVQWTIDNGLLAIWPTGQSRNGSPIDVSPETGMVGYPSFNQQAVIVRTIYNSNLALGKQIKVKSQLTPANGTWNISNVAHDIESMVPNGQRFSIVQGTIVGTGAAGGGGDVPGGGDD
jgi:hypothetical protein